ncbi:MAG: hypothetical protein F6K40_21830 [Okeania sp. SIO3I5]|nr:hypothetical protein [Okeania sp. SIO3I5]NEQ38765.1 hypothetical protein [Okeania sp. SIO3I5]
MSTRKPVDALYGRCITKIRTSLCRLGYRRSQRFELLDHARGNLSG